MANNDKAVQFLSAANEAYKNNRHNDKSSDTYFFLETLAACNLIERENIEDMIRYDVRFVNASFQRELAEFNAWYVKEIGNSKTKQ